MSAKLTKAQARYLTSLVRRGPQFPPDGPGCWPLQNSLSRAGYVEYVDYSMSGLWQITPAGRAALTPAEDDKAQSGMGG